MTYGEAKAAVDKAVEAVRAYKKAKRATASTNPTLDRILDEELNKASKQILIEAYEVGMSGKVCGTCNGTGRV
jgi:hypothetical protein